MFPYASKGVAVRSRRLSKKDTRTWQLKAVSTVFDVGQKKSVTQSYLSKGACLVCEIHGYIHCKYSNVLCGKYSIYIVCLVPLMW